MVTIANLRADNHAKYAARKFIGLQNLSISVNNFAVAADLHTCTHAQRRSSVRIRLTASNGRPTTFEKLPSMRSIKRSATS
jgi:hypothetical protein